MWLEGQGAKKINPGNAGGKIPCGNFSVSITDARHSASTIVDGAPVYLGPANGLVVESAEAPTLYHMGDTGIFGDMALIAELYQPKIGLVPVGGRFTMDGAMAALAVKRFFDFETAIPCHYGTFPRSPPTPPNSSRRCGARKRGFGRAPSARVLRFDAGDSRDAPVIARSEATQQYRGRAQLLDCFAPLAMTTEKPAL